MAKVTNAQLKTIIETNTSTTNANFKKAKQLINGVDGRVSTLETNASNLDSTYVKVESGKGLSEANFTSAEKTKLAGLSNYDDTAIKASIADKADADDVYTKTEADGKFLTEHQSLAAYAKSADVYTKTEADGKFLTEHQSLADYAKSADVYTKTEVDGKLSGAMKFKGSVATVAALPSDATLGDMYNVEATGANYAFDGTNWDKLSENIDLSGCYTKSEVDGLVGAKENTLTGAKLNAVESGITATKVSAYDAHVADADIHLTTAQATAIADVANKATAQDITDTINDIFGSMSITAWDSITIE